MINAPATRVEDGMPASASATLEPFPLTAGWLACSHKDFDSEDAVCYTRNVCMDPLEVSTGYAMHMQDLRKWKP
jgi:hypothetical protein